MSNQPWYEGEIMKLSKNFEEIFSEQNVVTAIEYLKTKKTLVAVMVCNYMN